MIHHREDIVSLLKDKSFGCEIGVFEGGYSQVLADSGKFAKLYLVDTFHGIVSSGDKSGNNNKTYLDGTVLLEHNRQRFSKYNFIEVIQANGITFLQQKPNYFDFVYIDTVHTYHHTKEELEAAYHAVKTGGYITGHDFNEKHFGGLVRAVREFCEKYKLSLETTDQDYLESYIIVKQ